MCGYLDLADTSNSDPGQTTSLSPYCNLKSMYFDDSLYENEMHGISLLIYDDVPGGAGHARQLSDRVPELVEEAYKVVDGHCGCGAEKVSVHHR